LLSSSVVFGDNIDSETDDRLPVKYIIKSLSNTLLNEDYWYKTEGCTDISYTQ